MESRVKLAADILPEVATARNSWKRKEATNGQVDLSSFILDVLEVSRCEDSKGIPVGVLADKARKAYIEKTGKTLGEKRMPTEIKTLVSDGKLVITNRRCKNGEKLVGTPEDMKWRTHPEMIVSEPE